MFLAQPSPAPCECGFILSWACLLSRDPTIRSGPPRARGERLPWGFLPPSRHECEESTRRPGSRPCLCSAPSVSHALDGFLLFTPCRLVSSGCHVRGSLSRGFSRWPARRARRPPVPSCRWRPLPASELPLSRQLRPRRLQGLHPTIDSSSPARRLRLTATRSPPEVPAPAGFPPHTLQPFITAPPLMTLSPAPRSDSGGGSSACRSVRGLLLCLQTISLFELSGHPPAARATTGEAPTSRTISRPPDAPTIVQRACHPQPESNSSNSKVPVS